jgi:hypothetical protein
MLNRKNGHLGKEVGNFLLLGYLFMVSFVVAIVVVVEIVSLCSPGWPQTCSPPASVSQGLEVQACATMWVVDYSFTFIIITVLPGVQCDIYKSSYNVS